MAVLTGSNGELRYRGARVGKCRSISIDVSRDALETTGLGDYDRTYVEGLRGSTGSATVLYDETDPATVELASAIFKNDEGAQPIEIIVNAITGKAFRFRAITTQMGTPVSAGEVIACSFSFQISGPFEETI
jgi:hypothetical protein